jgi:hypothetical protein
MNRGDQLFKPTPDALLCRHIEQNAELMRFEGTGGSPIFGDGVKPESNRVLICSELRLAIASQREFSARVGRHSQLGGQIAVGV